MKALFALGVLASLLPIRACVPARNTSVEVRNETDFPLEVVVLYDDEQNLPEEVLEETGAESVFTLAPGGVQSVTRECDDLQIVRVSGDLQLLGGLGPSRTSRVYRDGDDFGCGDRLVFIYTAPAVPTSLNLSVSIEE